MTVTNKAALAALALQYAPSLSLVDYFVCEPLSYAGLSDDFEALFIIETKAKALVVMAQLQVQAKHSRWQLHWPDGRAPDIVELGAAPQTPEQSQRQMHDLMAAIMQGLYEDEFARVLAHFETVVANPPPQYRIQ